MIVENAQIIEVFLGFEEIPPGDNFVLKIFYDTNDGGGRMVFNPLDIPKILKSFEIDELYSLTNKYMRIKKESPEKVGCAMQNILSSDDDEWINTDNRYLGDDFFIE